jgi:hypothetical protein
VSCAKFDQSTLPTHLDGNAARAWLLPVEGNECLQWIGHDILIKEKEALWPYRIVGKIKESPDVRSIASVNQIITNQWMGKDFYSLASGYPTLPGYHVVGSFLNSDAESGTLVLNLRRGDQLWYRAEPKSHKQRIFIDGYEDRYIQELPSPSTSEWVLLEFSNKTLPEKFNVRFVDGGSGWGEWSAIGLGL